MISFTANRPARQDRNRASSNNPNTAATPAASAPAPPPLLGRHTFSPPDLPPWSNPRSQQIMATKVKDLLYSRIIYGGEEKGNQKHICKNEEIKSTGLYVFSPFAGDRDPHR